MEPNSLKEAKGKKKGDGKSQLKAANDADHQLPNNKQAHEVRCFKCNKLGHIAAKCRTIDQRMSSRSEKKRVFVTNLAMTSKIAER